MEIGDVRFLSLTSMRCWLPKLKRGVLIFILCVCLCLSIFTCLDPMPHIFEGKKDGRLFTSAKESKSEIYNNAHKPYALEHIRNGCLC